jgi:hypothetical protein
MPRCSVEGRMEETTSARRGRLSHRSPTLGAADVRVNDVLVERATWDPSVAWVVLVLVAAEMDSADRNGALPPVPRGAEQRWVAAIREEVRRTSAASGFDA